MSEKKTIRVLLFKNAFGKKPEATIVCDLKKIDEARFVVHNGTRYAFYEFKFQNVLGARVPTAIFVGGKEVEL